MCYKTIPNAAHAFSGRQLDCRILRRFVAQTFYPACLGSTDRHQQAKRNCAFPLRRPTSSVTLANTLSSCVQQLCNTSMNKQQALRVSRIAANSAMAYRQVQVHISYEGHTRMYI